MHTRGHCKLLKKFLKQAILLTVPGVYTAGNESSKIEERRDIIRLLLVLVHLSIGGSIQNTEDNRLSFELAPQFNAYRIVQRPRIQAPRTKEICHQTAVIRVADLVRMNELEKHRFVLENCVIQIDRRVLVELLNWRLREVEAQSVALQRCARAEKYGRET